MNLLDELARIDLSPAALAQVQALIEQQQARLVRQDAVLAEQDFKIKVQWSNDAGHLNGWIIHQLRKCKWQSNARNSIPA